MVIVQHYRMLRMCVIKCHCCEVLISQPKYEGVKVKAKVNFFLEQATKAQRGTRGIALLFS
jgi:hypothetical protein